MRLLFVLPAVVVPLALGAAVAICRQLTEAARSLETEMRALHRLVGDLGSARLAIVALDRRRAGARSAPR